MFAIQLVYSLLQPFMTSFLYAYVFITASVGYVTGVIVNCKDLRFCGAVGTLYKPLCSCGCMNAPPVFQHVVHGTLKVQLDLLAVLSGSRVVQTLD